MPVNSNELLKLSPEGRAALAAVSLERVALGLNSDEEKERDLVAAVVATAWNVAEKTHTQFQDIAETAQRLDEIVGPPERDYLREALASAEDVAENLGAETGSEETLQRDLLVQLVGRSAPILRSGLSGMRSKPAWI
jgi:ParB-like chromosome segregation protein Spo0J